MRVERFTPVEQALRTMAMELRASYGCLGMKLSTEDMGDTFDWINLIANKVLADALPVYVKIGGPNAMGDLKQARDLGVAGIIAPMVESPYALQLYVAALRTIFPRDTLDHMLRGFNAETITCYEKLEDILTIPEAAELNHISVGRGDLYRSMGKTWDDPAVLTVTRSMVDTIKAAGIPVSVAAPTPHSAQTVVETIQPDKVNSANVYYSVRDTPDIYEAFKKGLIFENALTRYRHAKVAAEAQSYQRIIDAREARLRDRAAEIH